jgi:diguanylate cyclase (GGDEF)-like protein/putative nucleotidyltransferase with HDIG domain
VIRLVGLAAIATTWLIINTGTLSGAIALSSGRDFWTAWREGLGLYVLNFFGSAAAAGLIQIFYDWSFYVFLLALPFAAVFYQLYRFYIDKYEKAQEHIAELNKLYLQTVEALATAVDAKDRYTHGHIRRVQAYGVALGKQMGITDEKEVMAMRSGALLHDIGKIAIPEYILNKPTVLTESEYEKMKIHPAVGALMLKGIDFPFPVEPLVKSHHERWDGKGYPEGLEGEKIPLSARILSLVDCYDALTTNRPYRSPMGREEVIEFFKRESGRAYDPAVVATFVEHIDEIEAEGKKIEVPALDIWGVEAEQHTENVRPLEKVQPTLSYSKAMDVSQEVQVELYSIFEFVRSAHSLQSRDILTFVGMKLERLIPFDAAVFYLLDPEKDVVRPAHRIGPAAGSISADVSLPLYHKLSGWVAANNQALSNLPPFPDFINFPEPKPNFETSAIAPMNDHGNIVGTLALYRQDKAKFSDQEFRHLEIIAGQTAVALQRSLARDGQESLFDELTGLPNGYQMYLMFDQVAVDAQRYEYPLALLAYQIEGLQNIKRRYGHLSSNEMLRFLANHLKTQVRDSDILVRYSEDQFLSLHPKMDRSKAEAFKSRIQDELDRQKISVRHGIDITPRVAVGLTQCPEEGTRLEDLLAVAEWRLSDDRKLREVARRTVQFPS